MSELLDLSYRVELEAPLHCGTGFARGMLDRAVARNGFGDLYIPGSTVKGRVRHGAEALAPRLQLHTCSSPHPENMCRRLPLCDGCLLFGAPVQGEALFFDDCQLLDDLRQDIFGNLAAATHYRARNQTWGRAQVMLDRRQGVAADGHLFTSELGVPALVFTGRISGVLPEALSVPATSPATFLVAALRVVESLGGDRSRGLGHCRLSSLTITLDGQLQDMDSLVSAPGGE